MLPSVEPQLLIHLKIRFLLELTNLTGLEFLKDNIKILIGRGENAIKHTKNYLLGRQLLEVGYGPQV